MNFLNVEQERLLWPGWGGADRIGRMKVLALNCNNCGAPLQVPPGANFFTCSYRSARLAIKRAGGGAFTEVLEAIENRTQGMAQDIETIRLQNELERLDREWKMQEERYRVRGKDGEYSIPTKGGSIRAGLVMIGFGVCWMIVTSSMVGLGRSGPDPAAIGHEPFFSVLTLVPLFGLILIAAGIYTLVYGPARASAHENARRDFELKRRDILRQIQESQTAREA